MVSVKRNFFAKFDLLDLFSKRCFNSNFNFLVFRIAVGCTSDLERIHFVIKLIFSSHHAARGAGEVSRRWKPFYFQRIIWTADLTCSQRRSWTFFKSCLFLNSQILFDLLLLSNFVPTSNKVALAAEKIYFRQPTIGSPLVNEWFMVALKKIKSFPQLDSEPHWRIVHFLAGSPVSVFILTN